jgi:hypothetical protein
MLKFELSNLDGLSDEHKALYAEKDGKFLLKLEGYEDPTALKNAKNHEKAARQKAELDLKTLRTEFDELKSTIDDDKQNKHRKTGNVAELDASWNEKFENLKTAHAKELASRDSKISKLLVDNVADTMAAELSETPEFLVELIKKRLKVEDGADGPETRVVDANGALSASTIEELREEFKSNKKYAAVIRGSSASGGGSGGGGDNRDGVPKAFKDMSEKERTALHKSDPVKFNREFEVYKAAQKTV